MYIHHTYIIIIYYNYYYMHFKLATENGNINGFFSDLSIDAMDVSGEQQVSGLIYSVIQVSFGNFRVQMKQRQHNNKINRNTTTHGN